MFDKNPSYTKLQRFAEKQLDLTDETIFTEKRIHDMCSEACGIKMIYAAQRIESDIIDILSDLAGEGDALKKMRSMQEGEVINTIEGFDSEDRAVLHTAMRDIFDDKKSSKSAKDAAILAEEEHAKLKDFLDDLDAEDAFTDMLLVGIGGSDLGPRALYMALQAYKTPARNVHFIANVDPDDASAVMKNLDLTKTLVVIVSKSGTTLETLTNETFVAKKFADAGLDTKKHFVAVTAKGSPMDDPEKYRKAFYMWDYVGGRYSVTSMVGNVILGFALGYDAVIDIMRGAHDMDKNALESDIRKNLPLLLAMIGIWNRNFLRHETLAIIPYSQALVRFTAHLQQCDMESNGKRVDKNGDTVPYETGPIIWGEPGTNAQHSFYQLLHQGTTVVPVELIGFKESQYGEDIDVEGTTSQQKLLANMFAQSIAFATGQEDENPNKTFEGNRPNTIIIAKKLDAYTMGALLALYEHKIAFQGFVWNINSFDQEGVQLGKRLANTILDTIKTPEKTSYPHGKALLDHIAEM
ncbi:MAG: glucose-6-phosphate isomerase [Waddliaceae bacterium]|jgi:glucose-6-phosphate isomerase|nr:glucose-6-phosphate isomerase [Waddliaceae bacterium]MBT3578988.1 glucose-6-phosphate isomerase [Waddliaceae bacterium]MBT4444662.1 glucose-6-phosphate isomerase [Waddliaceae bacterium]MBT6929185.1 glucose-6-phosphate isomerase [Waddliaceae bacterium]MBT7265159.1 glucose-6-phosphate isomerase [Waddliaceae bacterium]